MALHAGQFGLRSHLRFFRIATIDGETEACGDESQATADEKRIMIVAEVNSNSASSGRISTEGADRMPAAARLAKKLRRTTNQP